MQVKDPDARAWYEKEAAEQTWSVRTLQRNISSQYYYRMLKTQKKEELRRKNMKLKKKMLVCILLLICICSLAGCKKGSQKDNEKSGKLSVVTTIFPYYDFVKNIAGDKVELSMIVPAGQDLHSFKPDSTDMSNVLKADVLIYNSGTSEKWVDSLLKVKSKEAKKIKKVPMMDNASDIVSSLNEDGDIKEQTGQREYDEHLWTSPVCAKKIVSIIEEKLCDADKENADYYKKNAKKYIKKLEDVDYELREVSENAGIKHLIFADGFSMRYMASELGLAYSAAYPVCGGYQKPKKQTISYLEERIKEEKIPVIFKSENDKSDVAEKIAKKTGAKVVLKALEAPLFHISANAGLEGAVIINKVRESEVGTGFDALNEKYVNMVENGILDPAKVTRSALQADIAATVVTVIAYFFYDFHLNRVSGYYRVFMIMGLLSLFIANFRRIFNNVGDKLRASVLWVLIINNTIPLLSFVLSKNPGGMSDLPVYLMPIGNIYIILALLFSYLMNYMKVFKDDVERQVLLRMAYTEMKAQRTD